jgi:GNAT superfamily N-acetyltransferase
MQATHRPATLDDTHRLFELRRQSITKLAPRRSSIAEATSWAESLTVAGMEGKIRELEIWIAEIGGTVAGWGAIRGDRLEGLYANPDFAGQGIGTGLLALLEGLMRGRGIAEICTESSANAETFYFRHGFERAGPPTSRGGLPMRKRLR